ncbi:MAG: tripartite tricarboxylate transporter TctB family protein [Pseudomonadota bacterium]
MSDPAETKPRSGGVIFAALFLICAALLLSQLGEQAKFSSKAWLTKKMFAQPAFWPGVAVIGMVLFGVVHVIGAWRARAEGAMAEAAFWLRPLEYLIWFMVYVFAVPQFGYLLATVIFMVALAFRAGYRSARMLGLAALTGLGIVLIFKTALSVKIPGGAVYEALPDALRNFMIVNF